MAPCATAAGTCAAAMAATPRWPSVSENIAEVYAPTAMKPACPIENWPVKPFTRLSETARMMLIPIRISTWKK